jgi:hypothetical protein
MYLLQTMKWLEQSKASIEQHNRVKQYWLEREEMLDRWKDANHDDKSILFQRILYLEERMDDLMENQRA